MPRAWIHQRSIDLSSATSPAAITTGQIPANSILNLLYDGTNFQISGGTSSLTTLAAVGAAPNANAATIVGSTLTMQPANASFPGVLLAADWTTFNNKQATVTDRPYGAKPGSA